MGLHGPLHIYDVDQVPTRSKHALSNGNTRGKCFFRSGKRKNSQSKSVVSRTVQQMCETHQTMFDLMGDSTGKLNRENNRKICGMLSLVTVHESVERNLCNINLFVNQLSRILR
jgi:hypothetical protein